MVGFRSGSFSRVGSGSNSSGSATLDSQECKLSRFPPQKCLSKIRSNFIKKQSIVCRIKRYTGITDKPSPYNNNPISRQSNPSTQANPRQSRQQQTKPTTDQPHDKPTPRQATTRQANLTTDQSPDKPTSRQANLTTDQPHDKLT